MKLSQTWSARLQHGGQFGRKAALAVLTGLAVLGGMAGCKVFLAPEHPDFAAIAQRVHNEQDQVGAFAADFVVSWLTATTTCQGQPAADQGAAAVADTSCKDRDAAVLQRFITTPDGSAMTLPQTPAAVVTIPQVVSVISAGSVGDADLYTAVVAANERPYASAQPTRAFYQVPVSVWHYQPRALAMPARINGPGPGADIKLGYRQTVSTDSPIYAVLTGFVRTYLTSTTGLDRYVVAGTPLVGVGGYQSAIVTAARLRGDRSRPARTGQRDSCAGHCPRPDIPICDGDHGLPAAGRKQRRNMDDFRPGLDAPRRRVGGHRGESAQPLEKAEEDNDCDRSRGHPGAGRGRHLQLRA